MKSKYLILEIFGFANTFKKIGSLLFGSSKMLRDLGIRNRKALANIVLRAHINPFDFDNTAAEHFGITLKLQKKLKERMKLGFKRFLHVERKWLSYDQDRLDLYDSIRKIS